MGIISDKKDERSEPNPNISPTARVGMSATKSLIGESMNITGTIQANEEVVIEGKVKGTINVSSLLTVGHQGYVNAEINANEVVIQGKAEGNITATDRVEIYSNGEFLGDVNSKKLVIKEGAIFKGNVNMEDIPGPAVNASKPDKSPVVELSEKKPDK